MRLGSASLIIAVYTVWIALIAPAFLVRLNFVEQVGGDRIVVRQPFFWYLAHLAGVPFLAGGFLLASIAPFSPVLKWVILAGAIPALYQAWKKCDLNHTAFDLRTGAYARHYPWSKAREWRPIAGVKGVKVWSEYFVFYGCYILLSADSELIAGSLMRENDAAALAQNLATRLNIALLQ